MAKSVARIVTLLLTGVAIGITLGAIAWSTLPIWLGVATIIAISIPCIAQGD